MSLSVCNYGTQPQFKGTGTTENGVPYYKTNKGTIAGAILAVPAVAANLAPKFIDVKTIDDYFEDIYNDKTMEKDVKETFEKNHKAVKEWIEHNKKLAIPFAVTAGVLTVGCGILYDKIRNKNAKAAANAMVTGDMKNVGDGFISTSKMGTPYYKSENGVKYGVAAGAVCGLAASGMNMISNKKFLAGGSILTTGLYTLGGLILGAIVQKSANKAAEKHSYYA